MKLNKSKNKGKGKVHPSPASSSTSNNNNTDPLSSFHPLLPTTILTFLSVLSIQDREVLAYMMTHSLKSSLSVDAKNNKDFSKTSAHPSPSFECCCFVCFSSYWNRWNSSKHREIMDQAMEAFEEKLAETEKHKKHNNNKSKSKSQRREKMGSVEVALADVEERESLRLTEERVAGEELELEVVEERESRLATEKRSSVDVEERDKSEFPVSGEGEERESGVQQQQQPKGLARKVLPDFIGFFQSRLWNRVWGPNV